MARSSTSLPRFNSPVHPVVRYKRDDEEEDCVTVLREGRSAYSDGRGHPVLISDSRGHPVLISDSRGHPVSISDSRGHPALISSNSNSSDGYDDIKCDHYDTSNDSQKSRSKSKSSTREKLKITVTIRDEVEEIEREDDVALRSESHYLKGCAWRKQGSV